jgi:hypothetical protein
LPASRFSRAPVAAGGGDWVLWKSQFVDKYFADIQLRIALLREDQIEKGPSGFGEGGVSGALLNVVFKYVSILHGLDV